MKDELIKKLEEVRNSIRALKALGDELNDDQVEKLANLNKQAAKLATQIDAEEETERADAALKARYEREKAEAVEAVRKEEAAKARRLPEGTYQTQYSDVKKYDNLDYGEVALVIDTLKSAGKQPSKQAFKALALRIGELKDEGSNDAVKAVRAVKSAMKEETGIDAFKMESVEAAFKGATDPMYTGGANIGAEFVGTAYGTDLWMSVRAANVIAQRIPERIIPDGYSSEYFPLEGADPTWYGVSEVTANNATTGIPDATVTASQAGTDRKQITVAKIGARVLFSGEMMEDSLIAFAPEMRRKLIVSGSENIEHMFIDGDVETSANKNINDIAGTPAGTETFLKFDGFRKLALVTNTANSYNAGGAFVASNFLDVLKLMGPAGLNASDPSMLAFILDYNMRFAAMKLPEALTRDVYSNATFENGKLAQAYGYEVLYAYQMHKYSNTAGYERKVNTAGKVDQDTAGNNTTGAILAVRFDQWRQAYKRRMTLETTRYARSDSWEIVALARLGLAYKDTDASAIAYNVGL